MEAMCGKHTEERQANELDHHHIQLPSEKFLEDGRLGVSASQE